MKAKLFQRCGLALFLALFPLFGGCDQELANSAPVPDADVATSQPPVDVTEPTTPTDTNQTAPTAAQQETEQELENAPGKIISTPDAGSTNASNNPRLGDFVKLVEAGLGENVLMAYVTNSPTAFSLSSDDIVYLNDLGTPETVVTAMLQRDQQAGSGAAAVTTPAPAPTEPQSPYTPYATPTPGPYAPPAPAQPPADTTYADQNMTTEAVEPPLTPSPAIEEDVQQAPNASYSYFYDSLSPYGSWVDIEGYGPCWQPTAVVANPGWQPYGDHGHWAYTDSGWCWVSDYSWGWAPFHYGRWFRHGHFGWCWAPDTVWGPAWVSWRYDNAYCGWAPLPPTACYRPGFGFTYFGRPVGFGFNFGLSANWFVFVPLGNFHDRDFFRHRVPHREVTKIYAGTTVHNQIIRGNNNTLINRGVPVDRVAAASRTQIRPIHIRAEANAPRSGQLDRDGRSLSVFRPALPAPHPSNNPRLVGEGVQPNPQFNLRSRIERRSMQRNPAVTAGPERRPVISNPAGNPGRDNRGPQPGNERPNSIIMRGPDNANSSRGNPGIPPTTLRHGPVFQPQNPAQPGQENNRRTVIPQGQQQPIQPAPRQQNQLPPPAFNRPINNGPDLQQQQQQQRELQQREFQQRQFPQRQQPVTPAPRQEAPPRAFESPRARDQNANPGFRSEPVAPAPPQRNFEPPQRSFEQRQAPEVRSAPPQYSAPARQDNNAGRSFDGGGNRGGGGGGGNNNNNNNNNNGGGGSGRNR